MDMYLPLFMSDYADRLIGIRKEKFVRYLPKYYHKWLRNGLLGIII